MIPIMITDTCTAVRQAAPPDSLFEMICNADSSAVADIEAAASNSLADSLWTLGVEVIMMAVIVFLLCFLICRIAGRNPRPIDLEVSRIRYELMDIQKNIDGNFSSLEEAVRETGRRAKTNSGPRRSTSQARRRKTAKDVSLSGEFRTGMNGETRLQSHEEMQQTLL